MFLCPGSTMGTQLSPLNLYHQEAYIDKKKQKQLACVDTVW